MAACARRGRFPLIILGLVLLGMWALTTQQPQEKPDAVTLFPYGELRIAVDASNPPFAAVTADNLYGLEIDLGHVLGEYFGLPVRFVNMSYDGLYDALRIDQVDMIIAALTIDPLRTNDVRYTRHYFDAGLMLVSPATQPIPDMADLSGHQLAYEFGSDADALARRWLRRIAPFDTQPYEQPDYALDAVRLGLADAALVDAASAHLYLRANNWSAHFVQITHNWYPIAVPANQPARWQALNQALDALDANGTLSSIVRRWL